MQEEETYPDVIDCTIKGNACASIIGKTSTQRLLFADDVDVRALAASNLQKGTGNIVCIKT
jgi:hypothetical protein